MKNYKVILSEDAEKDYENYVDTIIYIYNAPLTAAKHYKGIYETLKKLESNPNAYSLRNNKSLQKYGTNVRRINYKQMAIIYTVYEDTVYIYRIVAGSMITEL